MTRTILLLPMLLAGCAALQGAGPRPVEAGIAGAVLRVAFSDGSVCRATLAPEGGTGTFTGCAVDADYAVTVAQRNPLEPLLGALVAPYADVTVTVAGQSTRFVTPKSRTPGFDSDRIE